MRSPGILSSEEWQSLTDFVGQSIGSILKGQEIQEIWICWPLKMGPIGCPETSLIIHQPKPG